MSVVLDIPNLRQRKSLSAYNEAHRAAIYHSERQALRTAEREWRAEPRPLRIHRTRARMTWWQRLRASFIAEFGRRWLLTMIGTALYFACGTASAAVVIAVAAGWWQP